MIFLCASVWANIATMNIVFPNENNEKLFKMPSHDAKMFYFFKEITEEWGVLSQNNSLLSFCLRVYETMRNSKCEVLIRRRILVTQYLFDCGGTFCASVWAGKPTCVFNSKSWKMWNSECHYALKWRYDVWSVQYFSAQVDELVTRLCCVP